MSAPRSRDAALADRNAIIRSVRTAVQQGLSLTLDDVVALDAGTLPKTSSGKLQRTLTASLYAEGLLEARASRTERQRAVEVAEAAKSQLAYAKLAILGSNRRKP